MSAAPPPNLGLIGPIDPAEKPEADKVSPASPSSIARTGTFFKNVLDQLPEATLTIDQSGFITYANARTLALLGKTAGELIDTPVSLHLSCSAILPSDATLDASRRPRVRYAIGADARLVPFGKRILPDWLGLKIIRTHFGL